MFELRIPDAGLYPFVTHAFAYTGLGAVGVIKVDPNAPPAPAGYPMMGDPFSGGVTAAMNHAPGAATTSASQGGTDGASGTTGGRPGVTTITIANVAYSSTDFDIKADMQGRVVLTLVNKDAMEHNLTVSKLGVVLTVGPNETKTFTFHADPGIYSFFCSIPGHEQAGMKGTMTVLPGMAH
jgi:plastocyanin